MMTPPYAPSEVHFPTSDYQMSGALGLSTEVTDDKDRAPPRSGLDYTSSPLMTPIDRMDTCGLAADERVPFKKKSITLAQAGEKG